jgi:hypothetical protein
MHDVENLHRPRRDRLNEPNTLAPLNHDGGSAGSTTTVPSSQPDLRGYGPSEPTPYR